MTTPEIKQKPVQAQAYVQAEAGAFKAPKSNATALLGAALGGEAEFKGAFVNGEIGYGTAFRGKAELGYELDLGKNMGLSLSAKAEYKRLNPENTYDSSYTINANDTNATTNNHVSWHTSETRFAGALKFGYQNKRVNLSAGVEAGKRNNSAPDIKENITITAPNYVESIKSTHNYHGSGAYVTPTVSAEVNMGSKGHWSFVADADMYQGKAGIRYTF